MCGRRDEDCYGFAESKVLRSNDLRDWCVSVVTNAYKKKKKEKNFGGVCRGGEVVGSKHLCGKENEKKKKNIEFSLVWLDEQFPTSLSLVDTFVFGLCVCVCVWNKTVTLVWIYNIIIIKEQTSGTFLRAKLPCALSGMCIEEVCDGHRNVGACVIQCVCSPICKSLGLFWFYRQSL